jgi:hypothetical protein
VVTILSKTGQVKMHKILNTEADRTGGSLVGLYLGNAGLEFRYSVGKGERVKGAVYGSLYTHLAY